MPKKYFKLFLAIIYNNKINKILKYVTFELTKSHGKSDNRKVNQIWKQL